MVVRVEWRRISPESEGLFGAARVLYTYVVPPHSEIVYIGRADGKTVGERWGRSAKEKFWDDLERERRIFKHAVLVGVLELEQGSRLTRELLADVESLLIHEVGPWGNVQSRQSRISRPGLRVVCGGEWPFPKSLFVDRG